MDFVVDTRPLTQVGHEATRGHADGQAPIAYRVLRTTHESKEGSIPPYTRERRGVVSKESGELVSLERRFYTPP